MDANGQNTNIERYIERFNIVNIYIYINILYIPNKPERSAMTGNQNGPTKQQIQQNPIKWMQLATNRE